MQPILNRIVLYSKNVKASREFYEKFFGFNALVNEDDRIVEMRSPHGGAILMLHPAAKSVKTGQVTVKLTFDIENVEAFKEACLDGGLKFGATHHAGGYSFANAKDPDGNSISITSRSFVGTQ